MRTKTQPKANAPAAVWWMVTTHVLGLLIVYWGAANLFTSFGGDSGAGALTAMGLGAAVIVAGPVGVAWLRRTAGWTLAALLYTLTVAVVVAWIS